ncbi:hypothetical protein D3C81_1447520 [compost metagenome]
MDHCLPIAGTGKPGDDLPRRHDLARLSGDGHDHPVGIGNERGVLTGVTRNPGLRLGGFELCRCCVRRRFDLIVGRSGDNTLGRQIAIAHFIRGGLHALRTGGDDGLLLGRRRQVQVVGIDPVEHIAAFDRLAGFNKALSDFAAHAEGQIALHPCGDGPRKRARVSRARLHMGNPDDGRRGPGVDVIRRSAGRKEQRNNARDGCEYKTAPHTVFRSGLSGGILFPVTIYVNSHFRCGARLLSTRSCKAVGDSACRADRCGSVTGFR